MSILPELKTIDREILRLMQERRTLSDRHRNHFSEEFRKELRDIVVENVRSGSFGDGLEDDYAAGGVYLIGPDEMSDEELADQALQLLDFGNHSDDKPLVDAILRVFPHLAPEAR